MDSDTIYNYSRKLKRISSALSVYRDYDTAIRFIEALKLSGLSNARLAITDVGVVRIEPSGVIPRISTGTDCPTSTVVIGEPPESTTRTKTLAVRTHRCYRCRLVLAEATIPQST
ncbi:MAG: hypothetical protein ABI337_07705 [Nitrososphaera sp.]